MQAYNIFGESEARLLPKCLAMAANAESVWRVLSTPTKNIYSRTGTVYSRSLTRKRRFLRARERL